MSHRHPLILCISIVFLLGACGDAAKRPIGDACGDDGECVSGLCYQEICLDPAGDDDGDGLSNGIEASLGTRADAADTDGDGINDRDELDAAQAPVDTDNDGKIDALESLRRDADGDCIADPYDARDDVFDEDKQFLVAVLCPRAGVCGADEAGARVVCGDGVEVIARCDLGAVEGYEADAETSCDGLDNDCDGNVDEGLGSAGDGVCSTPASCAEGNGGCAGTCTIVDGAVVCGCATGFELDEDGRSCNDIDECAMANGGCTGTCTNSAGGFACGCAGGFELDDDGRSCNDIDECMTANGGCAGTCANNEGSFTCGCGNGFSLDADGRSCNDINECATANGGCAQLCGNTTGSFACDCNVGYTLDADGRSCNDINECATENGGCDQLCLNDPGTFSCDCIPDFRLSDDGRSCNVIDDCRGITCGGRGTCVDLVGAYRCDCITGFEGTNCETPVCAGGCGPGACVAPDTCDCNGTGYRGDACDEPVCSAGCGRGTCVAPDTCECDDGWYGAGCDGLLAFVSSTGLIGGTMGNGGTSFDAFAKASAHCRELAQAAGYEGDFVGWISTREKSAPVQIPDGAGPWYRVDGVRIAASKSELLVGATGTLRAALNLTERGDAAGEFVMTGTDATGKVLTEKNCGEWRATTGTARLGDSDAVNGAWTDATDGRCDVALPIYCLQLPPKLRMFITSATTNGNLGGVSGADAMCQSDADAAGLGGVWRAWLSTSTVTASSRMSGYPFGYRNMAGAVVATSFAGLLDRSIDAAVDYFANGTRRTSGTAATWTGTNTDGTATTLTCNDWTATTGNGTAGLNSLIDANWTAWGSWACSSVAYLYCLEQ